MGWHIYVQWSLAAPADSLSHCLGCFLLRNLYLGISTGLLGLIPKQAPHWSPPLCDGIALPLRLNPLRLILPHLVRRRGIGCGRAVGLLLISPYLLRGAHHSNFLVYLIKVDGVFIGTSPK